MKYAITITESDTIAVVKVDHLFTMV